MQDVVKTNQDKEKDSKIKKCAKCGAEVKSFMLNREGVCGDCLQAKWDAEARAYSAAHPVRHDPVADFFGGEDNFTAPMTKADHAALAAECEIERIKQEKLDAMMEHCHDCNRAHTQLTFLPASLPHSRGGHRRNEETKMKHAMIYRTQAKFEALCKMHTCVWIMYPEYSSNFIIVNYSDYNDADSRGGEIAVAAGKRNYSVTAPHEYLISRAG